ncbi:hypothetical protein, partial [Cetobacterium sp.]|uniref:hypothetical protein n=1 Tax=Cetobacterium sp. TaxID=2071632 RepID=UPI003EE6F970
MTRKIDKQEILNRINNNDKIDIYKNIYAIDFDSEKQVIFMNNGYKRVCSKRGYTTNPFKLSPFLDKVYGVHNLGLWLNKYRAGIRIVDENTKIYNDTKIKLHSDEWDMTFTMNIKDIVGFKSPRKQYDTSEASKIKISENEFYDRINCVVNNENYKDYKLISDYTDYLGNSTRLIFKHKKEGWLVSRKFSDLSLTTNFIIFNSNAKELTTLNMKNYLKRYRRHITLCDGQLFKKKQHQYKLKCKFHGEFEVDWNNFYSRSQDCPGCTSESKSRGEAMVDNILSKHNIDFKR